MDRSYAPGTVVRWEPTVDLPELPLSAFDMTWSAGRTLVCSGFYGHNSTEDYRGLIIQFDDVHAFASFDGFSDTLLNYREDLLPLRHPVPYGGSWPFIQIQDSRWIKDIVDEHAGMAETPSFAHWSVITFDQTLHVMAPSNPRPSFKGWIR